MASKNSTLVRDMMLSQTVLRVVRVVRRVIRVVLGADGVVLGVVWVLLVVVRAFGLFWELFRELFGSGYPDLGLAARI